MRVYKNLTSVFTITCLLLIFAMIWSGCQKSPTIDELAAQLHEGQSFDEVCSILGDDCEDIGSGAIIYKWDFGKEGYILVWFRKQSDELMVSLYKVVNE